MYPDEIPFCSLCSPHVIFSDPSNCCVSTVRRCFSAGHTVWGGSLSVFTHPLKNLWHMFNISLLWTLMGSHVFTSGDTCLGVSVPSYMSDLLFMPFLFTFIYLGENAHVEVKGKLCESHFCPSIPWIELRTSGLAANTSTHWTRLPILGVLFLKFFQWSFFF